MDQKELAERRQQAKETAFYIQEEREKAINEQAKVKEQKFLQIVGVVAKTQYSLGLLQSRFCVNQDMSNIWAESFQYTNAAGQSLATVLLQLGELSTNLHQNPK